MADSVLSKLLAADSDLESQEAKLIAQLNAIQAKRASLQSVLEIFDSGTATAAASNGAIAPTQIADTEVDSATERPAKASSKQEARTTKDRPAQSRKLANRSQSLRRGWQRYTRDEHGQAPLLDIVAGILESQPKKEFSIKEVVDTIVVTEIPSTDRKNARNRISNILAEGARKKQWYRPKAGYYRFSK